MTPLRTEILIGAGTVLLALALLNPSRIFMPSMMLSILIALFFLLFAAFALYTWKERPRDEREEANQMRAARVGFVAVTAVLVIAIGIQAFAHRVDPWLVIALGVGVLGKMLGAYLGDSSY